MSMDRFDRAVVEKWGDAWPFAVEVAAMIRSFASSCQVLTNTAHLLYFPGDCHHTTDAPRMREEIDRLKAELARTKEERAALIDELSRALKERDEFLVERNTEHNEVIRVDSIVDSLCEELAAVKEAHGVVFRDREYWRVRAEKAESLLEKCATALEDIATGYGGIGSEETIAECGDYTFEDGVSELRKCAEEALALIAAGKEKI